MKKLFKYLTLLIALGLSLVVLVACSNDKETPADTDPQQTVGNFKTIACNEIDELEDSVERIRICIG